MEYQQFLRKLAGKSPIMLNAVGVIVTNLDNHLLLIKRTTDGYWGIPGGHVDIGESLEQAAIRETFEETGLTLKELKLITVVSGKDSMIQHSDGSQTYYVTTIFRCNDFSGKLRGSSEGEELGFFDLANLPSPLSVTAQGVRDYLESESVP